MRSISNKIRKYKIYEYFKGTDRGSIFKTKFLFCPLSIEEETRWLESAKIQFKLSLYWGSHGERVIKWIPIKFINK
jgi:hypothetical protein